MSPILTVFEYEGIKIGNSFSPENKTITKQMANEISILEKKQKRGIFKWEFGYLKAQNWVGIISLKNIQIEILPKLDKINEREEIRNNLLFMLNISGDIPHRINNSGYLSTAKNSFIDLYISLLNEKIKTTLKNGIVSEYVKLEENSTYLKGRLNTQKHIRYNNIHKNRFLVEYDEFNADNKMNIIIKATMIKLLNITKSTRNKRDIIFILETLDGVNDMKFDISYFDNLTYNRRNLSYKEVIEMCNLFWKQQLPDFKVGKVNTFSLLFDMNLIYEKFIRNSLILFNKDIQILGKRIEKKREYKYLLTDQNNRRVFKLYPDILIKSIEDSRIRIIIDTKWKIINSGTERIKVSQSDIYQMYAYAREYQVKNIVLLYPITNDSLELPTFKNETLEILNIHIRTIDLSRIKERFNNSFKRSLLGLVKLD